MPHARRIARRGRVAPSLRAAMRAAAGIAFALAMATGQAQAGDPPATAAQRSAANLFVVVEAAGAALLLIDVDAPAAPRRFALHAPLRSAAAFTRDARHAYLLATDGWVGKLDLERLEVVAQTRVDAGARDLALSSDGRVVAVADARPHTLALFDAELRPLRTLAVADVEGRRASGVAALHDAPARRVFVAVLADVPELWEVSYDPAAEDVPMGKIHDFQFREGAFVPGYLNPRRTPVPAPLLALQFSADQSELLGERAGAPPDLVNLDVRKRYAAFAAAEGAALRCAASWTQGGGTLLALPNPARAEIALVDARDWQLRARVPAPGPGRFAATHDALPHLWVDAGDGRRLMRIDKRTLAAVGGLVDAPGSGITQLEFDRDARVALAPLRDADAVAVVDASTLAERSRVPARRPLAVYHVQQRAADRRGQCP